MADIWSNIGGKVGSVIDTVGKATGNLFPEYNLSESLQSWGGNPGSGFVLVPQAYAADNPNQNQPNSSQLNYTPYSGSYTPSSSSPTNTSTSAPTQQIPSGGDNGGGGGGGDPIGDYRRSLDSIYNDILGNLSPWRQEQEQGLLQQKNLAANQIQLDKQAGLDLLEGQRAKTETSQVRNLKDLANAINQSFNSYSNMLGVMGAGDSSAAKTMLPYALSRTEAQQRGQITRGTQDAMAAINERESQLHTAVMQENNKLEQAYLSEMSNISNWFNNAKMQVAQLKGEAARMAAEQTLIQALQAAQSAKDNMMGRQNALRDWATGISTNINQLRQNLQAVSDPSLLGPLPQFQGLNMNPNTQTTANYSAPVGFGFSRDEERLV